MSEFTLPDLSLAEASPGVHSASWGLTGLLYSGASALRMDLASSLIQKGDFGKPIYSRLELVIKLHDNLLADLAAGRSRYTVRARIHSLKRFYAWSDAQQINLTVENVQKQFHVWTEHLKYESKVRKTISSYSIYILASRVAVSIQNALELDSRLLYKSGIKKNRKRKLSTRSEKQNLIETFEMGAFLVDIANSLDRKNINERLPVTIDLRDGRKLVEWCGKRQTGKIKASSEPKRIAQREKALTDTSWAARYPLLNLRMVAELLIFIAQTGMNLAQAYKVKTGKFSYKSDRSGYSVRRIFKDRAKSSVEFHIYSEYRTHFEAYLDWRKYFFGDDPNGLLFPIASPRSRAGAPLFKEIRNRCAKLGIRFIAARELRNTRANWLLRRSKDTSITAEMNQHTESTLLREYIRPNHQIAIVEISRFIHEIDPALAPPGPGGCVNPSPMAREQPSANAPTPDCSNPAGCLFCVHQRDIKSLDHIWSLTTYRHLKTLEIASYKLEAIDSHPASATITEITRRLEYFKAIEDSSSSWIEEAELRILEGDYHPNWEFFVKLMEIRNVHA
ncbi:hypothetical protein [Pseudomonas mohnii]